MKIGTFEDFGSAPPLSQAEPINPTPGMGVEQPEVMQVTIPEQDIDQDTGLPVTMRNAEYDKLTVDVFDNAMLTMEDEEFDLQQKVQQLNLLQDAFNTIEDTENVSPAQVRAIGVQLSMLDKYLPREDRLIRDAHLGGASEDTVKNRVVTQEALGTSMKVLLPIIAAIGVMLGGLYLFLRSRKVADAQASHNEAVFKAMHREVDAAVQGAAETLMRSPLAKVANGDMSAVPGMKQASDNLDRAIEQIQRELQAASVEAQAARKAAVKIARAKERLITKLQRYNFIQSTELGKNAFAQAANAYTKYGQLGEIGEELAATISDLLKRTTKEMSGGSIDPAKAGEISEALGAASSKAISRIKSVGMSMSASQLGSLIDGADRQNQLVCFPMFPGSAGPILAIGDSSASYVSPNRDNTPPVTTAVTLMEYISMRASFNSIPVATRKAEKEAEARAKVGKDITELARKLRSIGNTDEERANIRGLASHLNSARQIITMLDRTWLELCACANGLTDLAHSSLEVARITKEAASAPAAKKPDAPQQPTTESLDAEIASFESRQTPVPVATHEAMSATAVGVIAAVIAMALGALFAFLRDKQIAKRQSATIKFTFTPVNSDTGAAKQRASSTAFAEQMARATRMRSAEYERKWKETMDRLDKTLNEMYEEAKRSDEETTRRFKESQAAQGSNGTASSADEIPPQAGKEMLKLRKTLQSFNFQGEVTIKKQEFAIAIQNYQDYSALATIAEDLGAAAKVSLDLLARELTDEGITPEANDKITQGLTKALMRSHDEIKSVGTAMSVSQAKGLMTQAAGDLQGGTYVVFPLFRGSISAAMSINARGEVHPGHLSKEGNDVNPALQMNFDDFMALKSQFETIPKATEAAERAAEDRARIGKSIQQTLQRLKSHKQFSSENSNIRSIGKLLTDTTATLRQIDQCWLKLCGDANRLVEVASLVKAITTKGDKTARGEDTPMADRVN